LLCLAFHLTNAVIFNSIHIFPWFMILATTIFFRPDWPRRNVGQSASSMTDPTLSADEPHVSAKMVLGFAGLFCYCVFQMVWPFAHLAEGGQTSWTERRHHFAWRMMLRGKTSGFRYYITDPVTGETWSPDVRKWISPDQEIRFVRDPEMILHLAHFLAAKHDQMTGRKVEVRALVLTSLNGRKPQLLIDPMIDLAKEPRGYHSRAWIRPLTESLPKTPYTVPLGEWEHHIELPPLPFLDSLKRRSIPSHKELGSAVDVSSDTSTVLSDQR
jgi:vitamin K-dependent gamma-carboxylase